MHMVTQMVGVLLYSMYEHDSLVISVLHNSLYAVAQSVEVLHYKPEGHGLDSQWCQWNFSMT